MLYWSDWLQTKYTTLTYCLAEPTKNVPVKSDLMLMNWWIEAGKVPRRCMKNKLETIFSHAVLIRLASNEIHITHLWPCGGEEKNSSSIWPKLADSRVETISKVLLYFLCCCCCCGVLWAAAASCVLCGTQFFIQRVSPNYEALQVQVPDIYVPPNFALQISVEEMDFGKRHRQILF